MTVSIIDGYSLYSQTSDPALLAWPTGTAADDVALVFLSDDSGSPVTPPGDWTVISDSAWSKTLTSGDIASDLSVDVVQPWSGGMVITRGTSSDGITVLTDSQPSGSSYSFGAASAGVGPQALVHSVAVLTTGAPMLTVDGALTQLDTHADTAGPFTLTSLMLAEAQTTTAASPDRTIGSDLDASWQSATYVIPPAGAGTDNSITLPLNVAMAVTASGGFTGGVAVFTLDLGIGALGSPVTEWPATPPAPSGTDGELPADEDYRRHVASEWPEPTLDEGVPVDWEPT